MPSDPPAPGWPGMKILIYGINYAPELTGIGKYSAELAEWLAARGHEVSVVTAPPYYPQWQVHEGYRASRYRKETLRGVTVRFPDGRAASSA
jgi:colanic acid biosynthesis glycosyl transferase WcaI